ncbi:MAG: hypothetical protein ACLR23_25260 [Clostridia bacterium]
MNAGGGDREKGRRAKIGKEREQGIRLGKMNVGDGDREKDHA